MVECERAEFLESLGVDTAKLCDLCHIEVASRGNESRRPCIALTEIIAHKTVFEQVAKKSGETQSVEKVKLEYPEVFTFEVRTTMGHYAIISSTYLEASETVREETREPVLSVRKLESLCSQFGN